MNNEKKQYSSPQVVRIENYNLVVGNREGRILVAGNTSGCLVEGVTSSNPISRFDVYDSGSQMVLFSPQDSTLLVQIPPDHLTIGNIRLAMQMFELQRASIRSLGIETNIEVKFVSNVHDSVIDLLTRDVNAVAVMPIFPSTRLFGEDCQSAVVASELNNKVNFIELINELKIEGFETFTPTSFVFDSTRYPESGFPPLDEIIEVCRREKSTFLFFKQNVSAGGHGVEKVDVDDKDGLTVAYETWIRRMVKERKLGSEEWDFHIQVGVPSPRVKDGTVESPCITAVIEPDGDSFKTQLLQVALQRLENGTDHIGNIINPQYESEFLTQYGEQLMVVLDAMAKKGLRGHVGIDVIPDESGKLFFIEVNPRLNGSSRSRIIRDHLPKDTVITTNNTMVLPRGDHARLETLANYFYDPDNPGKQALVITRFPRFVSDGIGFDFINDHDGSLEEKIIDLMSPSYKLTDRRVR